MIKFKQLLARTLRGGLLAMMAVALPLSLQAEEHEGHEESSVRAMALTLEAKVVDVDLETRQISLEGPPGNVVTMTARENIVKLEDIKVGDMIVATYLSALEGELREPTEEELAEPWLVLEEGAVSGEDQPPGMAGARVIRAVCTIEGMNRQLGTVTIKDPRGKLHVIGDVEPEKMEGVTLGQTIVVIYSEALALTLEHMPAGE